MGCTASRVLPEGADADIALPRRPKPRSRRWARPCKDRLAKGQTFDVWINRSEKGDFGFSIREIDSEVVITSMVDGGALQAWNAAHRRQKVVPGDKIVAANSVSAGYLEMTSEFWRDGTVHLQVMRFERCGGSLRRDGPVVFLDGLDTIRQDGHSGRFRPKSRLPTDQVVRVRTDEIEEQECSICLEDLALETHALRLPCQHVFHPVCAARWLRQGNKCQCPLCRQETCPKKGDDTSVVN